jgi:hypothetical protein
MLRGSAARSAISREPRGGSNSAREINDDMKLPRSINTLSRHRVTNSSTNQLPGHRLPHGATRA